MRILHLSTFLQGGAGRAITDLALEQQAAGHDVLVAVDACDEPGYQSYGEYLTRLEDAGIAVHRIHSTFKRDLARNLNAVQELREVPHVDRLDLVHAHAAVPSMIGRLLTAPARRPAPVVQTMHGWGLNKTDEQALSDVIVLNVVDEVVVPSKTSADLMRALGVAPELVSIVPYGVRGDELRPLPDADAILLADLKRRWNLVLGCVGTIGERKNQRLVIDALAQVRGAIVGCVFIGDGETRDLAEYARARGVGDRTVVLGYRPNASQYLRRTDACVVASRSEGQPLTILEAFRDGVPVIAADIDELREMVEHRVSGLLFARDDARSLAATIESTARGAARTVTVKAREQYEARYTIARMVDGYAEVYDRARRRRSQGRAEVA